MRSVAKPTGSCRPCPTGYRNNRPKPYCKPYKGDTVPLTRIRASRNIPTPLPTDVNAIYITPALRLYTPVKKNQSPLPLLIYLHGGGWTFGSINSCARFCQTLAATGNVIVLAVDYRLAPEHPFPDGLEDCIRAVKLARKKLWNGAAHRNSFPSEETVREAT